jgi:hypothetical protein
MKTLAHDTMKQMACLCAAALALTIASAPAQVLADEAKEIYKKGVQAAKDGEYEEALELFEEARNLGAPAAVLYNIGKCHDELGDYHLALEYYEEYLEDPKAKGTGKVKDRIKEIQAMDSVVKIGSEPPGAEVYEEIEDEDDQKVGITPLETTVEKGEHVYVFKKTGYLKKSITIEAENGKPFDIDVTLTPEEGTELPEDMDEPGEGKKKKEKKKREKGKHLGIFVEIGAGAALHPYTFIEYEAGSPIGSEVNTLAFQAGADVSIGGGYRLELAEKMSFGAGLRASFRTYELRGMDRHTGDDVKAVSLFATLLAVPSFQYDFHEILSLEASLPFGLAWLVPTGGIDADARINLVNGYIDGANLMLFDLGIGAALKIRVVDELYVTVEPVRLQVLFPLTTWKNHTKSLFDIDLGARIGYEF